LDSLHSTFFFSEFDLMRSQGSFFNCERWKVWAAIFRLRRQLKVYRVPSFWNLFNSLKLFRSYLKWVFNWNWNCWHWIIRRIFFFKELRRLLNATILNSSTLLNFLYKGFLKYFLFFYYFYLFCRIYLRLLYAINNYFRRSLWKLFTFVFLVRCLNYRLRLKQMF